MCFANKERLFSKMPRIKSRTQLEICGDCGASDPSWASINRGILLCADCCSVHRSLGRHISQVKSLRQGSWSASVLNFVNSLNANGANGVWEHCLMDSVAPKNLRRKPLPKDPLHPIKSDFIRVKHVNLSFVLKPNILQLEEDINCSISNAGGAGGSVVGSLGGAGGNTTSISTNHTNSTLLNCTGYGYNTNASTLNNGIIFENELNKELHASVRTSNLETSLRLIVQGADPNYYNDEKGSTPLHVAVKCGQTGQIELLLVYGANILTKDVHGHTSIDIAKINKQNTIAERLIEAIYEVTDRLCYFIGNRKPDHSTGKHMILPESHHKEISEQLKIARGKLQLIPNKMFEELVMDIYDEVDRREMEAIWATSALNPEIGAVPFLPTNPHLSATRNQGRQKLARFSPIEFIGLVTDVLIDANRRQNMAALCPFDSLSLQSINQYKNHRNRESNVSDDEPLYDAVASDDDYAALATPNSQQVLINKGPINLPPQSLIEVETLRRKLEESSYKIVELQSLVQKLSHENNELKSRIEPTPPSASSSITAKTHTIDILSDAPLRIDLQTNNNNDGAIINQQQQPQSYGKRPVSMFEPREGLYNDYRTQQTIPESRTTTSMYQMAFGRAVALIPPQIGNGSKRADFHLPQMDEIKRRTDYVTRCIQELWIVMQDMTPKDAFIPCSDRIRLAVADLSAIFSSTINDDTIINALQQLNQNTIDIHMECTSLQQSLLNDQDTVTTDIYMQGVRNCAYNLAMATKMLVTQFS